MTVFLSIRSVARGCAKGARAHPLEKKWLEGSTGLKNDPQGRQVFPLAGALLGKFLVTLLRLIKILGPGSTRLALARGKLRGVIGGGRNAPSSPYLCF